MELAIDKMNDGDKDVRFVPVTYAIPDVCDSCVIAG